MKKIALFPVRTYHRDQLSSMTNQELIDAAMNDNDVQVYTLEEYLSDNNDECYMTEDWVFPLEFADTFYEVQCEYKTDVDGVTFETTQFKHLESAKRYLKHEKDDCIADYQESKDYYGKDYTIEKDDDMHFTIQSEDWDCYVEFTIKEKTMLID